MDEDYEFEPSQPEIDEIYNNDYWLNVELPRILREPQKGELNSEDEENKGEINGKKNKE